MKMRPILKYVLLVVMLLFATDSMLSQTAVPLRGQHKVKRKETVFGIARLYDLKIEELIDANPEMNVPGYELKKGDILNIPFPKAATPGTQAQDAQAAGAPQAPAAPAEVDVRERAIRVGVMLPLHDINGDGRRMVEYYRGILMACDSLKKTGLSVDVHAWNAAEDCDLSAILADKAAARCDIIFGPLYSKQMDQLSAFVEQHDIMLVIPFSISAPQLLTNRHIFQVWQSPTAVNEATITHYLSQFKDYHPVFVDCNDSTSRKGNFTFGLRRQLEGRGIAYNITNLKSTEDSFAKCFSTTKPNMVILNTARSPELGVACAKLDNLKFHHPDLSVTLFGYTEWLMYTRRHLDNYYKYNAYIPSVFFYNPLTLLTEQLQQKYRWNFHADMQLALPRFALTGFDHAFFFLKGLHKYGKTFNGAAGLFGYAPAQTPLAFERMGNGGLQNRCQLFVHYSPDQRVEYLRFDK